MADPLARKRKADARAKDYFNNPFVMELQDLMAPESMGYLKEVAKRVFEDRFGFKVADHFRDRINQVLIHQSAMINLLLGPESRAAMVKAAAEDIGQKIQMLKKKAPNLQAKHIQFTLLVWERTGVGTDLNLRLFVQILE